MPQLVRSVVIDAPIARVWEFHASLDGLKAVTPKSTKLRIPNPPKTLGAGVSFTLIVSQPPIFIPLRWVSHFTIWEPPFRFVDEQRGGPFAHWRHEHRFESLGENSTRMTDTVDYAAPLGPLGRFAEWLFLKRQIEGIFEQRHEAVKRFLEDKPA